MRTLIAVTAAAVALTACTRSSTEAPASPPPAVADKVAAAVPAAPATPEARERAQAEKYLTEDYLSKFLVYQNEMLPMTRAAVGMVAGAAADGAKDAKGMEKALSRDERMKAFREAHAAALAKAGLEEQDVPALTQLTTGYMAKMNATADAEAKVKELEAKAKRSIFEESMLKSYREQLAERARNREEAVKKYGEAPVAAMDRQLPGYQELFHKQMEAVLGKPKGR